MSVVTYPPRVSAPRVRYSQESKYGHRSAFHSLQMELVFMAEQDLGKCGVVRRAIHSFINSAFHAEAFTADVLHCLSSEAVPDQSCSGSDASFDSILGSSTLSHQSCNAGGNTSSTSGSSLGNVPLSKLINDTLAICVLIIL